ncbi:MAG TPA: 2-phospho-L-lactate guanylyltransferase [Rhodospirillaceae bacterium]|nr:2-phospho-L-lactate guanylyltransferase [Rhodospirillaceae bacterium]HAA93211.1 2-phospho-L-lactate guanylyltransferase [Rhodospirillaceae bacterium]HAT36631.1 2-phospho-L-lactate guanylyltransferase [Rhodospirillaceae bacterium]|tara:strand:+ start:429 stop:1106 length:678 start_codon:yes stop_codon:yes gene_type:complete
MWAVLPAKDFRNAKERLSPALSPAERQDLFAAMLEDVLAAAADAPSLAGILVLTRDAKAAEIAGRYGARVEDEPANDGQSAAVTRGAQHLIEAGIDSILTLPGDTPNLRASEIETIIARHDSQPAMSIVPSHDERGSNCIALSPPDLIPFHFGHDSLAPHLDEAAKRNIEPLIHHDLPGLALDIDTPADLALLLESDADTRARAYLEASGIAERFAAEANRPGAA